MFDCLFDEIKVYKVIGHLNTGNQKNETELDKTCKTD